MKSTRDKILQTLLTHPQSTINDLAEAVSINSISVRHHLTNLQVDGFVKAEEERHGVGRPRLVYSLTDEGLEKFPTRYLQLTNRLLSQLKQILPENQIQSIFTQIGKSIVEDQADAIKNMTFEKKLDFIKEILDEQGFAIEWEKIGNDYRINEVACPFYHVGQLHPEVCTMDQALISSILSIPTEKIECVLDGDTHCSYIIKQRAAAEEK
ncbi:MAG: winged helix-turn-helix transcriptional regulator [Anaerolineaceae bacterium]|nr:winged helix-turn-helix transcriptional regulator [Anaerolineaceae bacterium]